jgi:acylphosphatase
VTEVRAALLTIRGRVQGVYYRASTRAQARRLGVCGWVRNEADRTVTAQVQGAREAVEALVSWCQQGPPHARVDRVDVDWIDPDPAATAFEIR